jgi:hypothetical protein
MNVFGLINFAFGLFATLAGLIVLGGVFHRRLSSKSTVRFLRWSLIASLAGLMPLTRHLMPVQQISIVSVYCSGAAIVAWRKFGLVGSSRPIFALSVTAVLYFDVVFVATRLFRNPPLFTALGQPLSLLQLVQVLFAAAFIVVAISVLHEFRSTQKGCAIRVPEASEWQGLKSPCISAKQIGSGHGVHAAISALTQSGQQGDEGMKQAFTGT